MQYLHVMLSFKWSGYSEALSMDIFLCMAFEWPRFSVLSCYLSKCFLRAPRSSLGHVVRACAVLRPRGIVLPQFDHRKLAGNDLSDMRRGRARKRGKKQQQNQGPEVAPALNHTLNR